MSQNIDSFFKKKETAADKRKAALAKRQQLLEKLNIPSIVSDVSKPKRVTKKKKHEEAIPLEPVRKSRRLQGAAPEFIPDDFILGEAKPFIPTSFEKEQEAEKEGTISYDGSFEASELAVDGDFDAFFKDSTNTTDSNSDALNVAEWTSSIQMSGSHKVVPERIYSMCIHPRKDELMIAAGDKGGILGFWSLPTSFNSDLPVLDNGMKDISEQGKCCQFKLSREPITRLFYNEDATDLFCCSYDKSIKRFNLQNMKFDTVFKLDHSFDDNLFIHHCIPVPTQKDLFYVSLSNGEILTIDIRDSSIQACFQAHPKKVNTIDIHPNLTTMCTASLGRAVRLWDIRCLPTSYKHHQHSVIKEPECENYLHEYTHPLSVNSAFFNQTGDMLVTTCQDNYLRVFNTVSSGQEEHAVKITHRNQTGKWLTKLMAEWYISPNKEDHSKSDSVQYFHCGSMDEPRQVNLYSVKLMKGNQPVVKALPSIFSPHIASIQSVVKMHSSFPIMTCGNTSGRVVVLMNSC